MGVFGPIAERDSVSELNIAKWPQRKHCNRTLCPVRTQTSPDERARLFHHLVALYERPNVPIFPDMGNSLASRRFWLSRFDTASLSLLTNLPTVSTRSPTSIAWDPLDHSIRQRHGMAARHRSAGRCAGDQTPPSPLSSDCVERPDCSHAMKPVASPPTSPSCRNCCAKVVPFRKHSGGRSWQALKHRRQVSPLISRCALVLGPEHDLPLQAHPQPLPSHQKSVHRCCHGWTQSIPKSWQ